ncbi:MAG: hypothetical protein IJF19_03580 [Clostridia bacterium]|nr:hypothetical protein [Clostridia bacterium]
MEKKVYFIQNTKDLKLAEKFCSLCCDTMTLDKAVAVSEKGKAFSDDGYDVIAVELGCEDKTKAKEKQVTYSIGQSMADVCGLNFQKREHSRSLEILCGSFMGRVNIPKNSEYTELSVLYCATGLFAAGVPMQEVLKIINQKIS